MAFICGPHLIYLQLCAFGMSGEFTPHPGQIPAGKLSSWRCSQVKRPKRHSPLADISVPAAENFDFAEFDVSIPCAVSICPIRREKGRQARSKAPMQAPGSSRVGGEGCRMRRPRLAINLRHAQRKAGRWQVEEEDRALVEALF